MQFPQHTIISRRETEHEGYVIPNFILPHSVLYISLHRYDHGFFFPAGEDGNVDHVGELEGEGYNVNIPWNSVSNFLSKQTLTDFYKRTQLDNKSFWKLGAAVCYFRLKGKNWNIFQNLSRHEKMCVPSRL